MECPLHQDERYCLSRNQRETHKNHDVTVDGKKDFVDFFNLLDDLLYSDIVLMKVRYVFDRVCLQRVHFSFIITLICLVLVFNINKRVTLLNKIFNDLMNDL
jgi:hypothetical protein